MTPDKTPSDAEIAALYADETGFALGDSPAALLDFARAVLAKWGSPVAATKVSIPTSTMEQEFQNHYRRGFEVGKKAATPQPTQAQAGAVALTDEWIRSRCKESWIFDTAKQWVRMTEAAHGIKEGGQHADQ